MWKVPSCASQTNLTSGQLLSFIEETRVQMYNYVEFIRNGLAQGSLGPRDDF